MAENPDREEVPGRSAVSPGNTRGRAKYGGRRRPGEGARLRALSRGIAAVAAGVLIGGGIGLLVGGALGMINPFVLGLIGIAVGVGVSVALVLR